MGKEKDERERESKLRIFTFYRMVCVGISREKDSYSGNDWSSFLCNQHLTAIQQQTVDIRDNGDYCVVYILRQIYSRT